MRRSTPRPLHLSMPQSLSRLAALGLALALAAGAALAGPAERWRAEWPRTDFSRHAVDLGSIRSGGPPRDGIPALSDPRMIPAAEAAELSAREGVVTVAIAGERARAYPLRYLIWHEIVNDRIGARPVAVTWCPLCNSAIVFDRRAAGRELSFGVTGKLRASDMVMYDRQTESWWQQATGEAIVGTLTGTRLKRVVAWMESWESFRAAHPDGLVMARPAASRPYGRNPYVGYDLSRFPFLYDGTPPPHGIPALARVVAVDGRAWPLERLRKAGEIREAGLVLSWRPGLASPLERADIAAGRDIGQVRVRRAADGADVPHDVMFAFAFHAFFPDGEWMLGPGADGAASD